MKECVFGYIANLASFSVYIKFPLVSGKVLKTLLFSKLPSEKETRLRNKMRHSTVSVSKSVSIAQAFQQGRMNLFKHPRNAEDDRESLIVADGREDSNGVSSKRVRYPTRLRPGYITKENCERIPVIIEP